MRILKLERELFEAKLDGDIELVAMGDLHIGSKYCNLKEIERYVKFVKERENRYVCLMGDELHALIPSRSARYGFDQIYSLDEQLDIFYHLFEPLKGRILTKVSSTHTGWHKKLSLHDIDREIARHLEAKYLGVGGYWLLTCGRKSYRMFQQHGSGGSQQCHYQLEKAMFNYPNADVYLIGHIHKLYSKIYTKKIVIGNKVYEKNIWGIRTGCFVGQAEWASEKFYPIASLGAPIIKFSSKKFDVSVILGLDEYGALNGE